jgi:hypothetical protein
MGYFEINMNMAIAFRVKVSYNFAISHTYLLSTFVNLAIIFNN